MAEYSPSVLFSVRLHILQPKCAPIKVRQQADFHFDSKEARLDFLTMVFDSKMDAQVADQWQHCPPHRELADAAFERAKQISEEDVLEKSRP